MNEVIQEILMWIVSIVVFTLATTAVGQFGRALIEYLHP